MILFTINNTPCTVNYLLIGKSNCKISCCWNIPHSFNLSQLGRLGIFGESINLVKAYDNGCGTIRHQHLLVLLKAQVHVIVYLEDLSAKEKKFNFRHLSQNLACTNKYIHMAH